MVVFYTWKLSGYVVLEGKEYPFTASGKGTRRPVSREIADLIYEWLVDPCLNEQGLKPNEAYLDLEVATCQR